MPDLVIERLGHRGDGLASLDGRTVFVPGALPGETVRVSLSGDRADRVEVLAPAPERVEPPCPAFGRCGGCVLQHLADAPYAAFKRRLVMDALADRGLTGVPVAETLRVPPESRRRATFAGLMAGRRPLVGFNERASHRLVAATGCRVVEPALIAALPALEAITAAIQPRKGALDLTVTAGPAGLDVAVSGLPANAVERLRLPLTGLAQDHDLARLSLAGEVVVERRPPHVLVDGLMVVPPPGGFLQASAAAEALMADLVLSALDGRRRIADLYAGIGTFALRLSRSATITAAEGDAGAVAALDRAARLATGRSRITAERRDLARRPYTDKELAAFDGVVFDPPRAGAAEQSAFLARSAVPVVVAVSCNPATLARDLRTLVDGGYRIVSVTPVDQFLWSDHVEAVAVLTR